MRTVLSKEMMKQSVIFWVAILLPDTSLPLECFQCPVEDNYYCFDMHGNVTNGQLISCQFSCATERIERGDQGLYFRKFCHDKAKTFCKTFALKVDFLSVMKKQKQSMTK